MVLYNGGGVRIPNVVYSSLCDKRVEFLRNPETGGGFNKLFRWFLVIIKDLDNTGALLIVVKREICKGETRFVFKDE